MAGVSVVVVGVDNSPWVQTVLLFLHDRGIPCELTAVPNLETIRANGNVIPVIQVYEGGELVQTVADSFLAMKYIDAKYSDAKQGSDDDEEEVYLQGERSRK
jgi:glutathione S-transferase